MKSTDRYFVEGVTCRLDGQEIPVANLSVGGFFAAMDHPPMRGHVLGLELALKDHPPFPIVGKVTWVNGSEKPRAAHLPRGCGIKITRIAFTDKLALLDLLKRSGSAVRAPHRRAR